MYGIILAGGSGSRLWPLSRELYPKQLLKIDGENSLLQDTYKRLNGFIPKENIISVTNVKNANDVKFQIRKFDEQSTVLSEPLSKNTAPAIRCTVEFLSQQGASDDDVVLIVPSDHLIKNQNEYKKSIEAGVEAAKQGYLVTFGIKPDYPETGYGYIKTGKSINNAFEVEKFTEKPDFETAQKYINDGSYYWNGGIFAGKISTFKQEFEKYSPEINQLSKQMDFSQGNTLKFEIYENMPNISIDYAIMEKSNKIVLVPLQSDWNDLGSWKSIYEVKEKDENQNVLVGNTIVKDVENSFIYSSSKLVSAIGVKNLIVVETEDAVMVCNQDNSQDVKNVYTELKSKSDNAALVHKTVFRPWGWYTCLAEGEGYLTKVICVLPKQKLSIQSHNYRSEHWVVLEGKALVILDGEENHLEAGQSIDIPLKAKHSLQNPYDKELRIIEVQKGDYISEDDIIRYNDIYGRV